LVHNYPFSLAVDNEWGATILKEPERVKRSEMRLFILLGDDPGLDSIQDHIIYRHPIPQMNWLLHPKHSEDLKLD